MKEILTWLWNFTLIRTITTLLITYLASKYIPILVEKYLKKYPQIRRILQKTGITVIWIIGLLITLSHLGVDVSSIITSLGLVGFAIGFALKDTVSNLISGIMIMLYAPFKRGDIIEFGNYRGKIQWIDMKYTTMCNVKNMNENDIVLIPNQVLFQKTIVVKEKSEEVELKIQSDLCNVEDTNP